ncbi:hypothetical protein [Planomicrobium sp. CPCC 101079]|uniref:hypothetical protein n=1 Tax=Planomicrobium sp. CPCC 101079 TaxID=2599618 RepID=UPI0011B572C2|nr:hypothetical protein [Planomicrobium sp. CPCC 101079]TWT14304.1 hypothetical protein FQV28_01510 [Planomicrobium sp. CPCC 101079]
MTSDSGSGKKKVIGAGLDDDYKVLKTILETGLYSVYLVSSTDRFDLRNKVMVIDHPPAQKPSTHFLAIEIKDTSTTYELMEEISTVVENHFAQKR